MTNIQLVDTVPIGTVDNIGDDNTIWVEVSVDTMHLYWYLNTEKQYILYERGEYPTSDCSGSDCCMVGNIFYWGLHKLRWELEKN